MTVKLKFIQVNVEKFFLIRLDCKPDDKYFCIFKINAFISFLWKTGPKNIFMLCFLRMVNSILTLYHKSDVCSLYEQHVKSKEKVLTVTSLCFEAIKEYAKKWTAIENGPSSFQNLHLIFDKSSAVMAKSLNMKLSNVTLVPTGF